MSVPATTPAPSSPAADRLPLGLSIDRRFTTAGQDPFDAFTFVEREALVRDFKTGEVKFQLNIEVPEDWDQGAVDVVASKYARKAGVPQLDDMGAPLENSDGTPVLGPERSAKQIIGRMARAWRIWGERGGYFATSDDAQAFEDEMAYMIMNQMGAPNSPQWFNTGLHEVHGIVEDPEGNWYYDPETDQVVQSSHKYERTAANACFIIGVEDNLAGPDGIMALATNEARLFKAGSGSGANLGKIREKGADLTGGGQSSGVMGFARAIDRSAGAIKSGGTTRRAAKMVILDADHPDIDEFIWCKVAEEKIARDLISLGYDSGYDTPGGAYDIVSFQNANHSVRIPRGFKALLDSNGDLELRSRRDGKVVKTIPAEKLWADIAEAAWFSADPGVQFDGIINDWATAPADGRIRGSNPCFTADTMVHTTKGLIAFGELMQRATAGEEFGVYTHDATAGEGATDIVATTPEAFMVTGHNEIVRVEFANGMRVRCTSNHRFWTTNRGWVRADELTEDDDVQLADAEHLPVDASWDIPVSSDPLDHRTKGDRDLPLEFPSEWSGALGHWLGWLVGDGSVNGTTVCSIYGSAEDRDEILPQHLPIITAINGGREPKLSHQDNGTVQARLSRRPIRRWLEELGVAKVTGPSKRVPWSMFQAPAEVAAAFLSGLFDADGSVHNVEGSRRWVQLGSTSWELLVDVQRLLTVFGVQSSLYRGKDRSQEQGFGYTTVGGEQRRYTQRNPNHQLRISAASMQTFHKHIGFRLTRKQAVLDEIMLTEQYRSRTTTRMASRVDDGVELTFNLTEPRNHSYMVNGLVVSNCSEFVFLDNTACNLASINLGKFFDADRQRFDVAGYEHAARLWTIALEITVGMSHYPTEAVAKNSYEHRPLGLGYANLGALVMRAGLPYDSREARAVMGAVTALMHARAYAASAEMAAAVGPCVGYGRNTEPMQRVLRNHRRAAYGSERAAAGLGDYEDLEVLPVEVDHRTLARTPFGELTDAVKAAADDMVDSATRHGIRNMQATVIAPTGCVVTGTMVATEHGLVRIGSLGNQMGEKWQGIAMSVLTDEGPRAAEKFFVNGLADTVEITTRRGQRIVGTPEHRVKAVHPDGEWVWKRFADIETGDLVPTKLGQLFGDPKAVRLPVEPEALWYKDDPVEFPTHMTAELAEVVGLFMGDGSLHGKGLRFELAAGDIDTIEHLRLRAKELFGLPACVEPAKGESVTVSVNSVRLAQWWNDAGFAKHKIPGCSGKGSYVPHVPDAVLWTNDPHVYAAFMRGLFEADGTANSAGVSLTTTKAQFADEITTVLHALGIVAGRKQSRAGISNNVTERVEIYGGQHEALFMDLVGFISARKTQVQQRHAKAATKRDWVPLTFDLVRDVLPPAARDGKNPYRTSLRTQALAQVKKRDGLVSRALVTRIYEETGDARLEHLLGFSYDTVTTVADGGERMTVDLSVPSNVTYTANGFISHNTIGLAMSCDTTGPEPDFALVKWKKLAGGGYMKIVNQSVPAALRALGYSEPQVDRIVTYALGTQTLNSNTPVNRDALAAAGVPAEVLDKVEAELPTSGNLAMAFAPHVVGRDIFTTHGLDPDVDAASMLLTALGFSADQIVESSKTICGHETVEGAPELRAEDLPVFDTANFCGDGTRFIAWEGHVRALGAIQPHVSGGISKTINMPHEATVEDIRRAHEMAYELGVKCVAVYRDGSKASQPLSRSITDADAADSNDDDAASQLALHAEIAPGMSPVEYYQGKVPPRFRLPKNRAARTFSFEVGGMDCYLTTGEYDDGSLGEIWVNVGKDGSTMHGAFSAFSIAVSLGLQRGVPLEHFVEKYKGRNFSPNGVVNHPNLKMASSIPDAIFRILGWWYGGRDDLVQVPDAGAPRPGAASVPVLVPAPAPAAPVAPSAPVVQATPAAAADAPVAGDEPAELEMANPYTGNLCPECFSSQMVKSGTCERCLACSATTGCS